MAQWHRLVHAAPQDVWSVLSDGRSYSRWVVGAHDSVQKDPEWPAEGSELAYSLKAGPWTYRGRTVSRLCEPVRRLELEAMSGLGSARIAFRVEPWGDETLVVVDEHPLRGPAARWHNAVLDAFLRLRHRGMLARLGRIVEGRAAEGGAVASGKAEHRGPA
ncbi:SRPBCC family protein [Streptomyces tritici]|uniref:SRPBCC family protein n=1 Tax=Streptomyces tritici TaxID=2054410 RepID=UPI003AF1A826